MTNYKLLVFVEDEDAPQGWRVNRYGTPALAAKAAERIAEEVGGETMQDRDGSWFVTIEQAH